MKDRSVKLVLLTLICALLFAACTADPGQSTQPEATVPATAEPSTEKTAAETEAPVSTAAETTQALTTEGTEPPQTEAVQSDWREKYEALPQDLQQALIPASMDTEDDFTAMKSITLDNEDWSGEVITSYDMTVIDCWMTWCGPCREEMPTLQKLSAELPDNICMMSVCFDGKDEGSTCRTIVTQCGVTYPVLLGDSVHGDPFDLSKYTMGVPTLLFIDSQGSCFARFVGRPLTPEIEEKDALTIIFNLALEMAKGE